MPVNLLPNASFELNMSQPIHTRWTHTRCHTNWGDLQNRLTLKVTALKQVPETPPDNVGVDNAPDGTHAARIQLESTAEGAIGHLTSPVIDVTPCQPYTLSVYARSDEASARLNLGVWTRPLDFSRSPDMLSWTEQTGPKWQRFSMVFIPQDLEWRAVIDLTAHADKPCTVWVDAVQLEEGPVASEFQTRFPVEAQLEGRQDPSLIHFQNDERKTFYLTTYNSSSGEVALPLQVQFFDLLSGEKIMTHLVDKPVPAGHREQELRIEFPRIGEFYTRIESVDGTPVGVDEYIFVVHPVIDDDYQGVLRTFRGTVEHLPAERSWLPWQNEVNWYSDCRNNIIVTDSGIVHVMTSDDDTVMMTRDGGLTWSPLKVTRSVNTILRDGSFLNFENASFSVEVSQSNNEGRTWKAIGGAPIPQGTEGLQVGPITELRDGSLIWPIGRRGDGIIDYSVVYCYRSDDRGHSWNEGHPMTHGGEPAISELSDGRLMAVCRNNPTTPVDDWERVFENEKPWQLWQRTHGAATLSSYVKRTTIVESDNGGIAWTKPRPGTLLLDQIRGHIIELPDGRLVLFNTHRVPTLRGGERARLSEDGGETWGEMVYYMNAAKAYPGYASSCVLPPELGDGKAGMILTVVGERSESNWGSEGPPTSAGFEHMPRLMAVRWRP